MKYNIVEKINKLALFPRYDKRTTYAYVYLKLKSEKLLTRFFFLRNVAFRTAGKVCYLETTTK